jgi:hypothetical protein
MEEGCYLHSPLYQHPTQSLTQDAL